jgi:hypothetical protein
LKNIQKIQQMMSIHILLIASILSTVINTQNSIFKCAHTSKMPFAFWHAKIPLTLRKNSIWNAWTQNQHQQPPQWRSGEEIGFIKSAPFTNCPSILVNFSNFHSSSILSGNYPISLSLHFWSIYQLWVGSVFVPFWPYCATRECMGKNVIFGHSIK